MIGELRSSLGRARSDDGESTRLPGHDIKNIEYTSKRLFVNCPFAPENPQLNPLGWTQLNVPIFAHLQQLPKSNRINSPPPPSVVVLGH